MDLILLSKSDVMPLFASQIALTLILCVHSIVCLTQCLIQYNQQHKKTENDDL